MDRHANRVVLNIDLLGTNKEGAIFHENKKFLIASIASIFQRDPRCMVWRLTLSLVDILTRCDCTGLPLASFPSTIFCINMDPSDNLIVLEVYTFVVLVVGKVCDFLPPATN